MLKKISFGRRILARFLILAMLLPNFIFEEKITVLADETYASSSNETVQKGISVKTEKELSYLGSNTYRLTLTATSAFKQSYETTSRTMSEDGVFVVPTDGFYLLELWGGDGGNGQDVTISSLLGGDTTYKGGKGGQSGYTYGYTYLQAGESLVYTIGTKGENETRSSSGGGVNEGGTSGDIAAYGIGGGGGYSAVYKFTESETKSRESGGTVSADDRLDHYIMIAAGGGGGGAGNSYYEQTGTADGGDGGIAGESSVAIALTESSESYTGVSGVCFPGTDGKSSGSSTSYVGVGGTDLPGERASTFTDFIESTTANNWVGTHNSDLNPGAGGNGNLRGGAGGAGFCGGSGGIMAGSLIPANVGGGGGGASFIADSVTYTSLTDEVKSYLRGYADNDNESATGGKLILTYLGEDADTKPAETALLDNVKLEGELTDYFEIQSIESKDTNGTVTYDAASESSSFKSAGDGREQKAQITVSNNSITITGADMTTSKNGSQNTENPLSVNIIFKPKDGFLGGNGVQVIKNAFTLTPDVDDEIESVSFESDENTDYCNVALDFTVQTNSYMISGEQEYMLTDFYTDSYEEYRENVKNSTADGYSDYISEISDYSVSTETGEVITDYAVTVNETSKFIVYFTVKPKYGASKVGPSASVDGEIFQNTAIVTLNASGDKNTTYIGNAKTTVSKTLEYYDNAYHFGLEIEGEHTSTATSETKVDTTPTPTTADKIEYTYEITASGWYTISARGGAGGNGQGVKHWLTSSTASGGSGTPGAVVTGIYYLEKGQILEYKVGENAKVSYSDNRNDYATYSGAGGGYGTYTSVSLIDKKGNTSYLIIASGGAGGGGAVVTGTDSATDGNDGVYDDENISGGEPDADISSYNGQEGKASYVDIEYRTNWMGISYPVGVNDSRLGEAGTRHASYRRVDSRANDVSAEDNILPADGPAIAIKLTKLDTSAAGELEDLTIDTAFTQYFTLDSISMTDRNVTTNIENYDISDNKITLSDLDYRGKPTIEESTENGVTTYTLSSSIHLKLDYVLTPSDGFMGGNEVPLLLYGGTDDYGIKITNTYDSSAFVYGDIATDYANVELNYDFAAENFQTENIEIICGEKIDITKCVTQNKIPVQKDWQDDYVDIDTETGIELADYSPGETCDYTVYQMIKPSITAEKAQHDGVTVVSPVDTVLKNENYFTVTVKYSVTTNLENLRYVVPETVDYHEELSGQIIADSSNGYFLPEAITVKMGGVELAYGYTYDADTGIFVIDADVIEQNIEITAKARQAETYTLTYIYETKDHSVVQEKEKYKPGVKLKEMSWYKEWEKQYKNIEHYTYTWDLGDLDTENDEAIMPAKDCVVTGRYLPETYKLTIRYVDEGDNRLADDYVAFLTYNSEYSVVYADVSGYVPVSVTYEPDDDPGVISADTEITVTYKKADGAMYIIYQYKDGTMVDDSTLSGGAENKERKFENGIETVTIEVGNEYTVTPPLIEGYTPEIVGSATDTVEIKVTPTEDNIANGIVIYVRYSPDKYTVTFDPNGGQLASGSETKTVEYNNTYGYDPTITKDNPYTGLPTAYRANYSFDGWYDENGTVITEDTIVETPKDHTLTAHWKYLGIVSVTITWGSMTFDLDDAQWNPETHMYEGENYTPEKDNDNKGVNWIEVTNEGTNSLSVYYTYKSEKNYSNVSAYFTDVNEKDTANAKITKDNRQKIIYEITEEGSASDSKSVGAYLWLQQNSGTKSQYSELTDDEIHYGTFTVNVEVT